MSNILPFIRVEDFDARLTEARLDAGGSLADADILEMAAALERMGEALQSEIERIKAGR